MACLFTDEFDLVYEEVREELKQVRFGPMRQLTAAYLVFSYNAHVKDYQVVELEFIACGITCPSTRTTVKPPVVSDSLRCVEARGGAALERLQM